MKKLVYLVLVFNSILISRSPFRPKDPLCPKIIANWEKGGNKHILENNYLEEGPLFKTFDKDFFYNHQLPNGRIKYRNQNKYVESDTLYSLIEGLLEEIRSQSKKFKNFEILKNKDFYAKEGVGFIVLKFKDYPFILKLFIETPKSLTEPFKKSWQASTIFIMGGGVSRFLLGFTRIKNLEVIKAKIKKNDLLKQKFGLPRKWFYLPKNTQWIDVEGKNIGLDNKLKLKIPGMYAIIADEILSDKKFTIFNREDRTECIKIWDAIGDRLDPNIDNFIKEKDTNKLVMIDTEYFPSLVGLHKAMRIKGYLSWYIKLALKYLKDRYGRHKLLRRRIQYGKYKKERLCLI